MCLRREPPDYLDVPRRVLPLRRRARRRACCAIPDALSTRAAALTEPTAIALHTVNLAGVDPDDRVLVTGGGPVGPAHDRRAARPAASTDITVSEPAPPGASAPCAVGAARRDRPRRAGRRHRWAGRSTSPYTIAFECSGNARAAEAALDQLDYAGTLVFVGTGHESPRINHNRMIMLELTPIGAYNYDADGFAPALELLASGALPARPAHRARRRRRSTGCCATMQRLAAGELAGKVHGPTRGRAT